LSTRVKFAKLSQADAERLPTRSSKQTGIGIFATFKISRREQMSKGTSMKKDQKKPKKKR
jgi:hypothetical protein